MGSEMKATRHDRKRLMLLTNASLLLLMFSGMLVTIVGLSAAMGRDEALVRMAGVSWFLENHWAAIMLCVPVVALCVTFGAGMMLAYAMQTTALQNALRLVEAERQSKN